ncbi:hypothetical protein D3C77_737190 [compost metagenome]
MPAFLGDDLFIDQTTDNARERFRLNRQMACDQLLGHWQFELRFDRLNLHHLRQQITHHAVGCVLQ